MTDSYPYSIEDSREFITELYYVQHYTEREILATLLSYNVQTNADQLRHYLELWQLISSAPAPSQDANPHQTCAPSSIGDPGRDDPNSTLNDRMQEFLQEDQEHERLALRMINLPQNNCYDEDIELSEQPSNYQQHNPTRERPKRKSKHDKR